MPINCDWKNWLNGMWNSEDNTPFPPKPIGIGSTIEFHALLKKGRIINK